MALTKKHFELIAREIAAGVTAAKQYARTSDVDTALLTLRHIAHNLTHEFAKENPNFDRARFLRACGF